MKTKLALMTILICICNSCSSEKEHLSILQSGFNPNKDLLSLHYDHAPDKDDGHSTAADRTILQSMFGKKWIKQHVIAVSGA